MTLVSNATKYVFPETEGSAFARLTHYMDKSTCSDYVSEGKKGQKRTEEGGGEKHSKNYHEPLLMVQLDELCWL